MREKRLLRSQSRGGSFFGCIEHTEMDIAPVVVNERAPLASLFLEVDAANAGRIVALKILVLVVLLRRCFSKIAETIVRSVSVDVIYSIRPPASHVEPSEPVCFVHAAADLENDVPIDINDTSRLPHGMRMPLVRSAAHEYSCVRGIVEFLAKFIGSNHAQIISKLRQHENKQATLYAAYMAAGGTIA